jgi:hypothetical protein
VICRTIQRDTDQYEQHCSRIGEKESAALIKFGNIGLARSPSDLLGFPESSKFSVGATSLLHSFADFVILVTSHRADPR